jgi:hypothetical protein
MEYLAWLVLVGSAVAALTVAQQRESSYRELLARYHQIRDGYRALQVRLKEAERDCEQLRMGYAESLRRRGRAQELERELQEAKRTVEYASAKRQKHLEEFMKGRQLPETSFVATFEPLGIRSFEERLIEMLEGAEFEIVIISPWIKRYTWEGMRVPVRRLLRRGGSLRIFMRGLEADFSSGLCDDIRKDVEEMGGEIILLEQLHAKLYVVDRREAIITSANLTRGGFEGNLEAGVWVNSPALMKEISGFVDNLYSLRKL